MNERRNSDSGLFTILILYQVNIIFRKAFHYLHSILPRGIIGSITFPLWIRLDLDKIPSSSMMTYVSCRPDSWRNLHPTCVFFHAAGSLRTIKLKWDYRNFYRFCGSPRHSLILPQNKFAELLRPSLNWVRKKVFLADVFIHIYSCY